MSTLILEIKTSLKSCIKTTKNNCLLHLIFFCLLVLIVSGCSEEDSGPAPGTQCSACDTDDIRIAGVSY